MGDVDGALEELTTWRNAAHSDVVTAEQHVAALHDLARRVEGRTGPRSGRLLREAADLVAGAVDELRLARDSEGG